MLDDCESKEPLDASSLGTDRNVYISVVEHSAGPSIPPRYSSRGPYRSAGAAEFSNGPADISNVEYEGFEVDVDDISPEDAGMVQAVSTSCCS